MLIEDVGASGARLITPNVHKDERGVFFRTFCIEALASAGIAFNPVQGNSSYSREQFTVRGMHFQRSPEQDAKLVRCSAGTIYDVIVDLRPGSQRPGATYVTILVSELMQTLYVPPGFAHGFQTLSEDCVVEYVMGAAYRPHLYDGIRHDDPDILIQWPHAIKKISDGDNSWPDAFPRMPWIRR